MLFFYFSTVCLSVLEKNKCLEHNALSGDIMIPISINKYYYVYEIDSVQLYDKINISGSSYSLEDDVSFSFKDEDKNIKISMKFKVLDKFRRLKPIENNLYMINISLKSLNEIIYTLDAMFKYFFKINDQFLYLKRIFEFYIDHHSTLIGGTRENYLKNEIPLDDFMFMYKKIYKRFLKDLELLKCNEIEKIVMKKTCANTLILMLKSVNVNPFGIRCGTIKYTMNGILVNNVISQMLEVAICNLYFFAFIYNEFKLI